MKRILITGGIGSGKSVVARIVNYMGFPVYDCDNNAKRLMHTDEKLLQDIKKIFGSDIYRNEKIDSKRLASIIFADHKLREQLNMIVHKSVRDDIEKWFGSHSPETDFAFVETAIAASSAIDKMVDIVWWVEAPVEIRKNRVINHRGMDAIDFENRLKSQSMEVMLPHYVVIRNDNITPLLPRIETLLQQ